MNKAIIISGNMAQDHEFIYPYYRLLEEDINVDLDFPGDNKFRKLIGVRMRILFVDAYVDYNMGNANNAINAGLGITFR